MKENDQKKNVTDLCKALNISRVSFYTYREKEGAPTCLSFKKWSEYLLEREFTNETSTYGISKELQEKLLRKKLELLSLKVEDAKKLLVSKSEAKEGYEKLYSIFTSNIEKLSLGLSLKYPDIDLKTMLENEINIIQIELKECKELYGLAL